MPRDSRWKGRGFCKVHTRRSERLPPLQSRGSHLLGGAGGAGTLQARITCRFPPPVNALRPACYARVRTAPPCVPTRKLRAVRPGAGFLACSGRSLFPGRSGRVPSRLGLRFKGRTRGRTAGPGKVKGAPFSKEGAERWFLPPLWVACACGAAAGPGGVSHLPLPPGLGSPVFKGR